MVEGDRNHTSNFVGIKMETIHQDGQFSREIGGEDRTAISADADTKTILNEPLDGMLVPV
ncbi:hypothetical protein Pmar_PMAR024546 [Perkinsus marinus ATCC 50983]|uniref:Uncharacterized protein n=1 Tax=Perkinsus marinus (strain ATCC 50983 / TXsc) TaxID=423536 RepID=C5LTA1_PERM5|nr:hypothetical protein Pmar_PMAR024546 [Perkinsus marinus ATCC 50983]EER00069.1 hypothetical protein Pmar_PMAR024546 [Perkinsus marinus ATCC 50983]|eukprot:XP_002767351.1 hypothetical protein Pmar_PMAR024546 [Perkinsus marinus ATCC 50983]